MDEDICFSRQSNTPNPSRLLVSIRTPFHSFERGSQQALSLLLRLTATVSLTLLLSVSKGTLYNLEDSLSDAP